MTIRHSYNITTLPSHIKMTGKITITGNDAESCQIILQETIARFFPNESLAITNTKIVEE